MGSIETGDVQAISEQLEARALFKTGGQLWGAPGSVGSASTGQLPEQWCATLQVNADYVVYSYQTPIAWHEPGIGWVRPLVTYSKTTTRHQHIVDEAIGLIAPGSVELYEGAYIRE